MSAALGSRVAWVYGQRSVLFALVACLCFASHALGQTGRGSSRGVVRENAPIYLLPDTTRQPLRTAAVGTVLEVLTSEGDWLQVRFQDPQFGARVGYIEARMVQLAEPDNLRPLDLSVSSPATADAGNQADAGTPESAQRAATPNGGGANRGGFTVLVDLGIGIQKDQAASGVADGLGGLNLGVGGFLTDKAALMFRISGTNARYSTGFFQYDQVSGVAGPVLQYWPSDRAFVEIGGGVGYWNVGSIDGRGPGLIMGTGVTLFNRGKHNLQLNFEYAPAFTNPAVHNVGITFGYQLL